ncbi:ATP-dependent nuclease subunit B [Helicobacter baculiformis]|uniref:ATP-dependent nuclease subunit B n=1 Tax=Helicobacter baculiformis TaxID=427351 RepID=A0ABV7ZIJ3_9HELI|nr:ATP-dependent nuclease subunit B [Helicobacter baculiformis]
MNKIACLRWRNGALAAVLGSVLFAHGLTEDQQILITSDAFHRGDFATAKQGYLQLYKETNNILYAKEAAISAASLGDLSTAVKLAMLYKKITKDNKDISINKILVDGYIQTGQTDKAIALLEDIRREDKSLTLDSVLGSLYLSQKRYDKAFSLLNKLYNQTHSEDSLEKLVTIYFMQNSRQEAVGLLSSHLKNYGCSPDLCQRVYNTLVQLNELQQAKDIFGTLYEKEPIVQNAQLYISILIALKEFDKAQDVAERYPFDRRLLLDLYTAQKKFALAAKQANLIYREKKDPSFLALEAIYTYEELNTTHPLRKYEVIRIVKKLERAIKERAQNLARTKEALNVQDAFFYNFLGYSLIDHDLDVKKGITYVKTALKIEPDSVFYMDSLAWGYYKLGKCIQAQEIFAKIDSTAIRSQPELQAHANSIAKCH